MEDQNILKKTIIAGIPVRVCSFDVIVAGSGAAGFNAADTLLREGVGNVAMITEAVKGGTSRNTGSDKQTYYKLSLAGGDRDSVRDLAETLFSGQAMDGDIALCEAASSVFCFTKLAFLGVPFPVNRYGEFAGYKTDHDPARRATSAGPYTSKFMTEVLEKSALARGLRVFDRMLIIKLLAGDGKVRGLLCLDLGSPEDEQNRFVLFLCPRVVWATGGPAAIYDSVVYPASQHGAGGAAFEAGALGRNLTEWQYGLASVKPRWNVSGTYMQALPRFVSVDPAGGEEREFLGDFFQDQGAMLSRIFLKGYQWPFDVGKLGGSSLIDILVFLENQRGRRVFLDFTHNPQKAAALDYGALSAECRDYLSAAGACFGLPIERLEVMNKPAVQFYRDRGIDLHRDMLEISLCVQHNNGGLGVDHWWRSNIEGLFPVGEAAGTHGVYRPGGSALNAGQAGSYRAACYIAQKSAASPGGEEPAGEEPRGEEPAAEQALREAAALAEGVCRPGTANLPHLMGEAQKRMTLAGGPFRRAEGIREALAAAGDLLEHFSDRVRIGSPGDLPRAFRFRDVLICQYVYLSAMEDYIKRSGKSRGSALYYHPEGTKPHPGLPGEFAHIPDGGELGSMVQEILYRDGKCFPSWREVRPIPQGDDFFEKVWSGYRENKNID
ncbi:MAG: FAD-binding protein [Treponema sp.]|jgi:succinate dehydrogenase/fumarate reductase flavoprotein subunit|nr:FAD-binding protein [Treponema sp.]